jgi:predicted Rossmann fold nucleotide-binding protein DprA/Smf involved in DNA uptake
MYEYILSSADEVIFTSDSYTKTCMKERNAKLAELADVLIAYSGRKNSGSAQTVRMAKEKGKTVYNLFFRANDNLV